MADLELLPLPYYLSVLAAIVVSHRGWNSRDEGWGIPLLAVTVTAGAWYLLDPIYNGYTQYIHEVGSESLTNGWWEVLIFFMTLGLTASSINKSVNKDLMGLRSTILEMIRTREIENPLFQDQVAQLAKMLFLTWSGLMIFALIRVNFDYEGLFFPYLAGKDDPWLRDRIGGGFDALYAFAGYFQIMLTALLGVTLALSLRSYSLIISGLGYFLAVPYYIFDRTRNTMLAVLLPGFMALVSFRIKGGIVIKLMVVIAGFMALEGWFKFVIENRDQTDMVSAFKNGGTKDLKRKTEKHLGFNMFEELGYINYLIGRGVYSPNWGSRYFAELVNPIPRVLWPGKPVIGIDYAIARGMAYGNQNSSSGGIAASISTGMIGQGVVNFGGIFGPIAAALLMGGWVAVLARQDLMGHDLGHLLLYAIGLVLTFNMGRDITLLVLYPFVFGWLLIYWLKKRSARHGTVIQNEAPPWSS